MVEASKFEMESYLVVDRRDVHLTKLSSKGNSEYIIKWIADGVNGGNTYFYDKALFNYEEYKNWLKFFEEE